jgi:phage/plasmid-like protein (TIGR03299 family)
MAPGVTAAEALTTGGLAGWNVRKRPSVAVLEDGTTVPEPGRFAVVRDLPEGGASFLGNVGSVYHVIQNEEHTALLDTLVDEAGAHFMSAGPLRGGKQVFITMKLPGHIRVGGTDDVEMYIAALNSFDGSTKFKMMVTPVRARCANVFNMPVGQQTNQYEVRHSGSAKKLIVQQAREMMGLTFDYLDEFQVAAERMIQTEMTQSTFEQIIAREFGAKPDAPTATVTRAENKMDQMVQLFTEADTNANIRGTAWAGFNALTEWYDHFAPTRGDARDTARATNAALNVDFKKAALQLMTV